MLLFREVVLLAFFYVSALCVLFIIYDLTCLTYFTTLLFHKTSVFFFYYIMSSCTAHARF